MPYGRLLATVYRRLSEEWGKPADWDECLAYGRAVPDWPAFPDSAEALAYLKRFYRLVILSNVDNASFAGSNRKLGVEFDAIYTAEDSGSYKPSSRNFDYMLEALARLGHRKDEVLHTAESMFHDHRPANQVGLASAWIHRRHAREGFGATMHPGEMPNYGFRFTSMAEMVELHRREIG
jgi:2-haloalkanoic acid dehalogenase type II